MDKKKLLFIFNPHSGKGQIRMQLVSIVDTFVKNGYEVTIYPTQEKEDAVHKVEEQAEEYDLVVCSGGDGTLDEVVTGMMRCDGIVPIGYIPAGSTNDFAQSLKIPKNMLRAAEIAVSGRQFPCDVGVFNEDNFVYIAAFGLFYRCVLYDKPEAEKYFWACGLYSGERKTIVRYSILLSGSGSKW